MANREARAGSTRGDAFAPADAYLQRISVTFDYPVYFTCDVFSLENPHLLEAISRKEPVRRHRLFAAVEKRVSECWPELLSSIRDYVERHHERLALVAEPLLLAGGEAAKNDLSIVSAVHAQLNEAGLDRQSFVLCVGGGALQDAVGYAAATTHRGVRIVRIPTTVLAQTDSGVGVKNGINAFGKKNFLGAFAPPFAVLNDSRFLETLSRRDKIAGMSEAVKVALIRDSSFYDWLLANRRALAACEPAAVNALIRRCAQIHLHHIGTSGDPFELGSARPLDFGHWAAHKLESLTRNRLRHGEAVAIGIALDAVYSVQAGFLDEASLDSVLGLFEDLGFRLWDPALELLGSDGRPLVFDGLSEFREHLGGELTVTLLSRIGGGFEAREIREDKMLGSLARLRERDGKR